MTRSFIYRYLSDIDKIFKPVVIDLLLRISFLPFLIILSNNVNSLFDILLGITLRNIIVTNTHNALLVRLYTNLIWIVKEAASRMEDLHYS